MNDAIALVREKGLPLVVVYHENMELGPRPGTRAFAFHGSIDFRDANPNVVKNYPNALNKTDLKDILREKGCGMVFIVGLSTVGYAMATHHVAVDLEPHFV